MSSFIAQFITKKNETVVQANLPPAIVNFLKVTSLPAIGIIVFMFIWAAAANSIDTSLGKFPGPSQVITQVGNLYMEHLESREKEQAFYQRQEKRNAERVAKDPNYIPKIRAYTGS